MKEEIKYLKGIASGFYKTKPLNHSGHFTFNSFDFETIDIKNTEITEPFNNNELKVGLYHDFITPTKDVRVFINETNYLQETIEDLLFTEIISGDIISINGEKVQSYTAIAYFKLKKKIVEPTHTPKLKIFNLLKTSPEETNKEIFTEIKTTNLKSKSYNNFTNLILGTFIIGLFAFLILFGLFGFSTFTWFIPLFFFLIMLFEGVKDYTSSSNYSRNENKSFLNFLGWLLLFYGLYTLFHLGFNYINFLLTLLGFDLIIACRNNRIFKFLGGLITLITVLSLISQLNSSSHKKNNKKEDVVENDSRSEDDWEYKPEESIDTLFSNENDTIAITYLKHNLSWTDNYQNSHKALLTVRKDHFNIASIKRNQLDVNSNNFQNYYHQIYNNLINQNKTFLDSIIKEYRQIGITENLNRSQFADMVVTSIQSIPYYLVHDFSHHEADIKYGGFIREYHQTGKPCLDKIKFGVQAPTEFMGNFKGDCDTRSLFLFHVLSKFGYSVVMLGSERYSHCIIGISGNYSGDFISYRGLKYYVWETTAKGFTPGNISSECSNMRYWMVELANNN